MKRCSLLSLLLITLSLPVCADAKIVYEVIDLNPVVDGYSGANSINESGQIVGQALLCATLFDPTGGGNNVHLTALGGNSSADAVNNRGQIVGWTLLQSDGLRAMLFDPTGSGNNLNLGTLGGDRSDAFSINDSGQIVGGADDISGQHHATLFDPTSKNIDLRTLGGQQSAAYSINNKGQIVGYAYNSSGQRRATLFDPSGSGNNIDLNTLIDLDSRWTLVSAMAINDKGCIVGGAVNPNGELHAFLLVPEPATIALLGLGMLCLRKRNK